MDFKTPVSILQECMVANRIALPEYNCVRVSGGSHNPIFEFVVKAGSIVATGCGHSKKDAKQDAAKNALKELSKRGLYRAQESTAHSVIKTTLPVTTTNDLAIKIEHLPTVVTETKTSVSFLQEWLARNGGYLPTYELLQISGEPHKPLFVYSVDAHLVSATGCGKSKQEAKTAAAKNALFKLSGEDFSQDKQPTKAVDEVKASHRQTLADKISDGCQNSMCSPVSLLQELASGPSPPEYKLVDVTGGCHDPTFEYIVHVNSVTAAGTGKTKKEAKKNAAKNALIQLQNPEKVHTPDRKATSNEIRGKDIITGIGRNSEESRKSSALCHSLNDDSSRVVKTECVSSDDNSDDLGGALSDASREETLDEIRHSLFDELGGSPRENTVTDEDVISKLEEIKRIAKTQSKISVPEYPDSFKNLDANSVVLAKQILFGTQDENDLENKLENVLSSLDIKYTMAPFNSKKHNLFVYTITIESNPIHRLVGSGESSIAARNQVVERAIDFLKIMLK